MMIIYVILIMFAMVLGLALIDEVFNKINYNKQIREAKLDRYRRTTEEMMKPSLLKTFRGFNFRSLSDEEDDEE